ncbi:hypothetical protein, partial [Enterococcus faecium]|nr:hypothetical protein [Enterococcus faecium]
RFHKSIIKEKTVDIIHKMDFVYSLSCDMFFVTASFSENSFLFLGVAHFFCNLILRFLADG